MVVVLIFSVLSWAGVTNFDSVTVAPTSDDTYGLRVNNSSGTRKFSVDSSGNTYVAGTITATSPVLTTTTLSGTTTLSVATLSGGATLSGTYTGGTLSGNTVSNPTFSGTASGTLASPTVTSLDATFTAASKVYGAGEEWDIRTGASSKAILLTTTSGAGACTIIGPDATGRMYAVRNDGTMGTLTIKKSGGTGIAIASGKTALVIHNGSDYIRLTADATH
jgi:hypothetical protein